MSDPTPSAPPARSPRGRKVLATLTVGLMLAGGLLLADWLKAREKVGQNLEAVLTEAHAPGAGADAEGAFDPRMQGWLPGSVAFSAPRETPFGDERALFAAGPSATPPEEVFGSILATMRRGLTKDAARRAIALGPSAVAALRLQVTAGVFPGGAFLLRLPPDLDDAKAGRLNLEPGGVMLAWQVTAERWEYVVFFFPQGFDLQAFLRRFGAPADALAPLGTAARDTLEPTLQLDPAAWGAPDAGGPRTVICKARGKARDAVERTARGLEAQGWMRLPRRAGAEDGAMAVLEGPGGSVWIATSEPEVAGGVVSVLFGA